LVSFCSKRYSDVFFRWANALEAFRAVLSLKHAKPPSFTIALTDRKMVVNTESDIWGVQPFLALRTKRGEYFHDNFIVDGTRQWTYPFDWTTLSLSDLSHIGIACNDPVGNVAVTVSDLESQGGWKSSTYHENDWL
jgi:hypothetical protein